MALFRIVLGSDLCGQTASINAVVNLVAFDTASPSTSSRSRPGIFGKSFGTRYHTLAPISRSMEILTYKTFTF